MPSAEHNTLVTGFMTGSCHGLAYPHGRSRLYWSSQWLLHLNVSYIPGMSLGFIWRQSCIGQDTHCCLLLLVLYLPIISTCSCVTWVGCRSVPFFIVGQRIPPGVGSRNIRQVQLCHPFLSIWASPCWLYPWLQVTIWVKETFLMDQGIYKRRISSGDEGLLHTVNKDFDTRQRSRPYPIFFVAQCVCHHLIKINSIHRIEALLTCWWYASVQFFPNKYLQIHYLVWRNEWRALPIEYIDG